MEAIAHSWQNNNFTLKNDWKNVSKEEIVDKGKYVVMSSRYNIFLFKAVTSPDWSRLFSSVTHIYKSYSTLQVTIKIGNFFLREKKNLY